ncbi:hypothetical protein UY3_05203 [Chelonia mydas]|uniref:Uncharacterized protein n=1 Tax=Chelonia mydas TaxID=8469 RepID=M7BK68_CHEMY|nr:hypothetical protein UY3_05203 [Chelonia mydas]
MSYYTVPWKRLSSKNNALLAVTVYSHLSAQLVPNYAPLDQPKCCFFLLRIGLYWCKFGVISVIALSGVLQIYTYATESRIWHLVFTPYKCCKRMKSLIELALCTFTIALGCIRYENMHPGERRDGAARRLERHFLEIEWQPGKRRSWPVVSENFHLLESQRGKEKDS